MVKDGADDLGGRVAGRGGAGCGAGCRERGLTSPSRDAAPKCDVSPTGSDNKSEKPAGAVGLF
jgi:hypothetical protein